MKNTTINDTALQMKELVTMRDELVGKRAQYVPEDMVDAYVEKMSKVTLKDLEAMSFEEMLEFNKIDEESVLLAIPEFDTEEEAFEYVKSMLMFFKRTDDFVEETDKMLDELNDIMKDSNKAINELLLDKGDKNIIHHLRDKLSDAVVKAKESKDPKRIQKAIDSMEAFEDSFKLDRLKELYRRIGSENIKDDATKRAEELYNRYRRATKELGLSADLIKIRDLEVTHLSEEYDEMNNLFVFICMKYIGGLTKTRGAARHIDGLFASQLTVNLNLLMNDGLPDEEKEMLLKNIKELLDIVR